MLETIEQALLPIVQNINTYLSNYVLVFLLVGVGLWYTIATKFAQVRYFIPGMKKVFGNLSLEGSHLQTRKRALTEELNESASCSWTFNPSELEK